MDTACSFTRTYDVAVVGGGIAGVAAAIQAARAGMHTALIEKTVFPGGLATTGLVYIYLPLCDGNGRQVIFGIAEELLRASIAYGPGDIPAGWPGGPEGDRKERFRTPFSPASYILALDELLENAGVEIWYDTLFCAAERSPEGNRLAAIAVENKSGRGRICAKQFIDATGDCSLARAAGLPCHDEINFMTLWALQYDRQQTASRLVPGIDICFDASTPCNLEKAPPEDLCRGIGGKAVSDFVLEGRRRLREFYRARYAEGRDRRDLFPLHLPAMPQFRKIYSLDAQYVLGSGEDGRRFEDSVGLTGDWRKPGPVWEIPYRALLPAQPLGGFLAAGRNAGARDDAWEVTRVIPPAALTGQVAGLAAAMAIRANCEPAELDIARLQRALREECGFALHPEEVGLPPKPPASV